MYTQTARPLMQEAHYSSSFNTHIFLSLFVIGWLYEVTSSATLPFCAIAIVSLIQGISLGCETLHHKINSWRDI